MFPIESDSDEFDLELAELEILSNGALDLIKSGRFDEAERICLGLKMRFPDQIDWINRSAELNVARGEIEKAGKGYEQCLAQLDRYPDGFDSEKRARYRNRTDRLRRQSGSA